MFNVRILPCFTLFSLFIGLLSAICAQEVSSPRTIIASIDSQVQRFSVIEIANGLRNPWALAFLPDGRLLITERPGYLIVLIPQSEGKFKRQLIIGTPKVFAQGQGGLLDVAIDPDFSKNQLLYLTWAKYGNEGAGTAIGRGRLINNALENFTILWELKQKTNTNIHFGSRIVFAPDGTILFNVSDRGEQNRAQNPQDPAGSIIRLNPDGSIPSDNPSITKTNWLPELWTIGHRNIQGMVFDDQGRLWATEHGPRGGDELNRINGGNNYGWPLATHGINYSGTQISPNKSLPGMEDPIVVWIPSIAPSGLAWVPPTSPFVKWRGNLLSGNLAGQEIRRIVLEGNTVIKQETLLKKTVGRIRDVRIGPDGLVYILNDANPGSLFYLKPLPEKP